MSEQSKIEWTDHSFNPWWGCQRVSPGCEHCYAETFSKRLGLKVWGPASSGTPRRFFGDKHWAEPLKWNEKAKRAGVRARVFCASMGDVFEDRPDLVEPRDRLFRLIRATPFLDWLLLTKRPQNIRRMCPAAWRDDDLFGAEPPDNLWLGTTAEDQERADERLPHLIACRDLATVLFVSYEPALGAVDWRPFMPCSGAVYDEQARTAFDPDVYDCARCGRPNGDHCGPRADVPGIDWLIVGGESGAGARPFDLAWARAAIAQCREAGVPVFFKQAGAQPHELRHRENVGCAMFPDRIPLKLRDRKGGDLDELPVDLQVRQWPEATFR